MTHEELLKQVFPDGRIPSCVPAWFGPAILGDWTRNDTKQALDRELSAISQAANESDRLVTFELPQRIEREKAVLADLDRKLAGRVSQLDRQEIAGLMLEVIAQRRLVEDLEKDLTDETDRATQLKARDKAGQLLGRLARAIRNYHFVVRIEAIEEELFELLPAGHELRGRSDLKIITRADIEAAKADAEALDRQQRQITEQTAKAKADAAAGEAARAGVMAMTQEQVICAIWADDLPRAQVRAFLTPGGNDYPGLEVFERERDVIRRNGVKYRNYLMDRLEQFVAQKATPASAPFHYFG